jgi:hypothetical protein
VASRLLLGAVVAAALLAAGAAGTMPTGNITQVEIEARFVSIGTKAFRTEVDKERCVSAVFVKWPKVEGAINYVVELAGLDGTPSRSVGGPPFPHGTVRNEVECFLGGVPPGSRLPR